MTSPPPLDIGAVQARLDNRHGWGESAYFFNNACDDAEHAVAVLAYLLYIAERCADSGLREEVRRLVVRTTAAESNR